MKVKRALSLVAVVALVAGAVVGWKWWEAHQSEGSEGIVTGNGRIEAVEVHIATKYPGRVDAIMVDEGDMVERDQVVAKMEVTELEAQLAGAEARLAQAEETVAEASAAIAERESALKFAEQELARALPLVERGSLSERQAEQREATRDSAKAALDVAKARHRTAEKAVDAARASVTQVEVMLAECELKAATGGRVLYRLAEPGEVLGAGGRLLTLVKLDDIFMEIFLPAEYAARTAIGAEARIILDAIPEYVFPGHVSFVSPEAQFTPKQVETHGEREQLMFRVKITVPPEVVAPHAAKVKTGVRGVAYVRVDNAVKWPELLATHLPAASP